MRPIRDPSGMSRYPIYPPIYSVNYPASNPWDWVKFATDYILASFRNCLAFDTTPYQGSFELELNFRLIRNRWWNTLVSSIWLIIKRQIRGSGLKFVTDYFFASLRNCRRASKDRSINLELNLRLILDRSRDACVPDVVYSDNYSASNPWDWVKICDRLYSRDSSQLFRVRYETVPRIVRFRIKFAIDMRSFDGCLDTVYLVNYRASNSLDSVKIRNQLFSHLVCNYLALSTRASRDRSIDSKLNLRSVRNL